MKREKKERLSKSAASGLVALIFLILGFQLALFVVKVTGRLEPEETVRQPELPADFSQPDVLPAVSPAGERPPQAAGRTRYGGRSRPVSGSGRKPGGGSIRKVESFSFDPNTVSVTDLVRLGLSERQAESIENYRDKGGRFRKKADFRKMYVVSDTLYARLEPYIDIPELELNTADSAALVTLRGIGPWYARKILDYRDRLGGFCDKAQLLEIDGLDRDRYDGFADEIVVDTARIRRLDLRHAPDSVLARHPYIGLRGARSIVRYRQCSDSSHLTVADLEREHVLPDENIEKLKKYIEIR